MECRITVGTEISLRQINGRLEILISQVSIYAILKLKMVTWVYKMRLSGSGESVVDDV